MMKKETLSESVYLKLKENLFEMNKGDFVSIRKYAAKYGVSYTPMRDAFIRLHEEGLLKKMEGVGYFVRMPDYTDFFQTFQIRKCIEPYALVQGFSDITSDDIKEMEHLNDLLEISCKNNDWLESLNQDIALHQIIVRKCKNAYLDEFYLSSRIRYKNFIIKNLSVLGEDVLKGNAEHLPLIAAIKCGEKQAAVDELNRHLDQAYKRMIACRNFPSAV